MTTRELSNTVVLEPNECDGYTVSDPALPGLVTEGATLEEARKMTKEAIACYLMGLSKDDEPFPTKPRVFQGH